MRHPGLERSDHVLVDRRFLEELAAVLVSARVYMDRAADQREVPQLDRRVSHCLRRLRDAVAR